MKFLLSTALVLFCTLSFASDPTPWASGIIITHENQLLKGEIRYDYTHDLVMFRETKEALLQTLTAHQVSSFRYYDEQEKLVHYFKTYVHRPNAYATIPTFFEVVVSGDVSYLRKRNAFPYFEGTDKRRFAGKSSARISPHILCYDYYVYVDDQIIRASRFKKEVLPRLADQGVAIRSHIKENNLKAYHVGDQIQLIQYANQQLASQQPQASVSASIEP